MRQIIFLLIVSSLTLSACGPSGNETGTASAASNGTNGVIDVAGVKIGMRPDEAREALMRDNPQFKLQESTRRGWNTRVIEATAPNEVIVLRFTETDPRAWFVGRSVSFPNGQQPNLETLGKELVKKYGEPSFAWNQNVPPLASYSWSYTNHGQKVTEDRSVCATVGNTFDHWKANSGRLDEGPPVNFDDLGPSCGRRILAVLHHRQGPIVNGMAVTVIDNNLARSDPLHPDNVAAAARKKQLEGAKEVHPKL